MVFCLPNLSIQYSVRLPFFIKNTYLEFFFKRSKDDCIDSAKFIHLLNTTNQIVLNRKQLFRAQAHQLVFRIVTIVHYS